MGQVHKAWREATTEELKLLERGDDPRMDGRDGNPLIIWTDGVEEWIGPDI